METIENNKEKMIHQSVVDLEEGIRTIIESCQPIGLDDRDYMTCVTIALAYIIEGVAKHINGLKKDLMDFDELIFIIQGTHERAEILRKEKK